MGGPPDHIEIERFSPFGDAPVVTLEARGGGEAYRASQAIVIGLDRQGLTPNIDEADFDILLTAAASPPRPWVSVAARAFDDRVESYQNAVRRAARFDPPGNAASDGKAKLRGWAHR